MDKVRYGIIGIGKMGSSHAKKLNGGKDKNAVLGAVCDIDPERIEWAKANLKGVQIFTDYKELIASDQIDIVFVATPHYLHPVIGVEALEAGKHVLIEKPAGVYTKAVRDLNRVAAEHSNQVFGIMYNQRTNPLYRKMKEIIDSGQMGDIKRINWIITNWYRPQAYYDQGGWRGTWWGEGGGVLTNQCPHQLDLFQWLGGMPQKVTGFVREAVGRKISVENDVTFYTEYENGASGVFVTSTHDFPGTNRLEISGDGGKLVMEQSLLSEKLTFTKLSEKESEFNAKNTKFMPLIPSKTKKYKLGLIRRLLSLSKQHLRIMQNFSRAVRFGETLIAPGAEGIRGLSVSNAVYLSGWLGKTVELPLNEDLYLEELNKKIEWEKQQNQ